MRKGNRHKTMMMMIYILCWCGVCLFVCLSVCHDSSSSNFSHFFQLFPNFFFFNFCPFFVIFFNFPPIFLTFPPIFSQIPSKEPWKTNQGPWKAMKTHPEPRIYYADVASVCHVLSSSIFSMIKAGQVKSELSARGTRRDIENTYPKMYPPELYPSPTICRRPA